MNKETLLKMKDLFAGKWTGEGFAKFPTISSTAYTEQLQFIPDTDKDAIFFQQKAWYKNDSARNGHTVFWDTGFIVLKEDRIMLFSAQVGGRLETYELVEAVNGSFTFNSIYILNDPGTIRSQRVFTIGNDDLHYELNMATHAAGFQNHLNAYLTRADLK